MPPTGSFERALAKFKANLSEEQLKSFSVCTQDDVSRVIDEIQKEHGPKRTLKNMQRIQGFLEAMEQLGKSIEVSLDIHPVVCFIWGPIKFLLGIAQTWHKSLDVLLDVYSRIGDEIPALLHYQADFEQHPTLTVVLEDYFGDILEFHLNALSVFCRRGWKRLFHSTWKTFNSRFDPLLTSLRNRRELLESVKSSTNIHNIGLLRDRIEQLNESTRKQAKLAEHSRHQDRMQAIRARLDAPDYEVDRAIVTEESARSNSGQWLFDCPEYKEWAETLTAAHRVLFLHAIPGAGKTTLMTTIVNSLIHLEESKEPPAHRNPVIYFYCKYDQQNKQTLNAILRGLLYQLLDQKQALSEDLLHHIFETDAFKLRTTETLSSLVRRALDSYNHSFILIDGLDECGVTESTAALDWFFSLLLKQPADDTSRVRILFSGQRDGLLDRKLHGYPSITLECSAHFEDIRRYCEKRAPTFCDKFGLDKDAINGIISKVVDGAQGMFLFAKVVMDNLLGQNRLNRLGEELRDDVFPKGIEKAYDRVFLRLFWDSHDAEMEDATKVLSWVLCARRPMRWREIQALFCISLKTNDADYVERRLLVTCKQLCGSFIDLHQPKVLSSGRNDAPEAALQVVHQTAERYLVRRGFVNPEAQNLLIATHCLQYLTTIPFYKGLPKGEVTKYAESGYFGLQDYAVAHWFDHLGSLRIASESISWDEPRATALKSLGRFLTMYAVASRARDFEDLEHQDPKTIHSVLLSLPGDTREIHALLLLAFQTQSIRKVIEARFASNPRQPVPDSFVNLHGNVDIFKCSKPWCKRFSEGFATVHIRNEHLNRHELPFQCEVQDCFAARIGFDRHQKLLQHNANYHEPKTDSSIITLSFPVIHVRQKVRGCLLDAVKRKDQALVETLLEQGIDPNGDDHVIHKTPIFAAASQGNFSLFKLLLNHGAKLSSGDSFQGDGVFDAAIRSGSIDIVDLLLRGPQRLNLGLANGAPVALAARFGQFEILKRLLECHERDAEKARLSGRKVVTLEQLAKGELLPAACTSGNLALTRFVLEPLPVDLNDENLRHRAILGAVYSGNSQLLDFLLTLSPVKYDFRGDILQALDTTSCSQVRTMLPLADMNAFSSEELNKILMFGCSFDLSDVVKTILGSPKLDVNSMEKDWTPLHQAVEQCHLGILELLLSSDFPSTPFDVSAGSDEETSPFLMAISLWSDQISTHPGECVVLLKKLMQPLILLGSLDKASLDRIFRNALLLDDPEIYLVLRKAATEDPEATKTFLDVLIGENRLDLVEKWLVHKYTRTSWRVNWMLIFDFFVQKIQGGNIEVREMLREMSGSQMKEGDFYLVEKAIQFCHPIFQHIIPLDILLGSLNLLGYDRVSPLFAGLADIMRSADSESWWPIIQAFTDAEYGNILLWASLTRCLYYSRPTLNSQIVIKRLLASGKADPDSLLATYYQPSSILKKISRIKPYMENYLTSNTLLFALRSETCNNPDGSDYEAILSRYLIVNKSIRNINAVNSEGDSALHILVHAHEQMSESTSSDRLLRLLEDEGVQLDVVDAQGRTALELAIVLGREEAASEILSSGRCDQATKDRAVSFAQVHGDRQMLSMIRLHAKGPRKRTQAQFAEDI